MNCEYGFDDCEPDGDFDTKCDEHRREHGENIADMRNDQDWLAGFLVVQQWILQWLELELRRKKMKLKTVILEFVVNMKSIFQHWKNQVRDLRIENNIDTTKRKGWDLKG